MAELDALGPTMHPETRRRLLRAASTVLSAALNPQRDSAVDHEASQAIGVLSLYNGRTVALAFSERLRVVRQQDGDAI